MKKLLTKCLIKFRKFQQIVKIPAVKNFSTISNFVNKLQTTEEGFPEDNEIYGEYFKIINLVSSLKISFDENKFMRCVEFMIDHEHLNNQNIVKDIELIFLKNIEEMSSEVKSKLINFLCKKVISELLVFNDITWAKIFSDFFQMKKISLEEFYLVITSMDNMVKYLLNKKKNKLKEEFSKKYYSFLNKDSTKVFNKQVVISTIDDIILFSKLLHFKIINLQNINDSCFALMNKIIVENKCNIILRSGMILPCVLVLHQETFSVTKTASLFKDAIEVINDHLFFVYSNYELLEHSDKEYLDKFSDNLFYYCNKFMSFKSFSVIFNKLVFSYYNRIKKNDNINWLNEITMLQVIALQLKYGNIEFWNEIFQKLNFFILNDFDESVRIQIKDQPKRLEYDDGKPFKEYEIKKNRKQSSKDLALQNISGLFYVGLIVEIASLTTLNPVHWDFIINSLRRSIYFRQKDLFFNLQFIYFYCRELYSNPKLNHIWLKVIKVFDLKLRRILFCKQSLDFFIGTIFLGKKISPTDLGKVIEEIIKNNQKINSKGGCSDDEKIRPDDKKVSKLSNIELFCDIYELLDPALNNRNDCHMLMGNTFVDLLRNENSFLVGIRIKTFIQKMKIRNLEEFKEIIFERIKSIIETETPNSSLSKTIIILTKAEILGELENMKLMFLLSKQPNLEHLVKVVKSLLSNQNI